MESYFDFNKQLVHKGDYLSGSTLLTNFDNYNLERYTDAILKTGLENTLIVSVYAYDMSGFHLPNHNSLHILERMDLSEFWKIYDSLKETA